MKRETPQALRVVPVHRMLPCKLTNTEIGEDIQRTSRLVAERQILEDELKAFQEQYRAKIRAKTAELEMLFARVGTQVDHRQVACEERYDYATGTVVVVRTDTHAQVDERPMTGDERQLRLGVGTAPAATEVAASAG